MVTTDMEKWNTCLDLYIRIHIAYGISYKHFIVMKTVSFDLNVVAVCLLCYIDPEISRSMHYY